MVMGLDGYVWAKPEKLSSATPANKSLFIVVSNG